jgi:hypothetical protein
MREQRGGDVGVVLNQISLRDPDFRPEEFVEIGQTHDLVADSNVEVAFVFWEFY